MTAEENDAPDVDAALQTVAAGASSQPAWREAVAKLSPQSAAEERIAVYQSVRDSGWLSESQSVYLIASRVEDLADEEAKRSLRELERRLKELEREIDDQDVKIKGVDPAIDEHEKADEYDKLSAEYQAAWDEVFVQKLNAFGEKEIAELYVADRDEFAYFCELGERWFASVAAADRSRCPDDLVSIASYLNAPRAEIARNRLAAEDICSALGNANFLTWYWHYGNATGGVTVAVRRGDAWRARNIVDGAGGRLAVQQPAWTCPACGRRISGEWEACWKCGSPRGNTLETRAEPPDDIGADSESNLHRILGAILIALFVLLPFALGLVDSALCFLPLAILAAILLSNIGVGPVEVRQLETAEENAAAKGFDVQQAMIRNPTVQRAWQSAVLALSFPPLGFYSLWLLWTLTNRRLPLQPRDRWRRRGAFALSIASIPLALFLCFAVVAVPILVFHSFFDGRSW